MSGVWEMAFGMWDGVVWYALLVFAFALVGRFVVDEISVFWVKGSRPSIR